MHVIQRGANRASVFHQHADYELFLEFLIEAAGQHKLDLHGFALMTNHVHLMATPHDAASLPRTMQQVGRRYVPYFNERYERFGTLWQGRYRAIPIDTERYWLTCLRYVEQNPVRARMVERPGTYPWSSYHAHALGDWPEWLTPHPVYLSLGSAASIRQANYQALCDGGLDGFELERLRYAVHHGWAYGSEEFVARIEASCGVWARPRPAGRRPRTLSPFTFGV